MLRDEGLGPLQAAITNRNAGKIRERDAANAAIIREEGVRKRSRDLPPTGGSDPIQLWPAYVESPPPTEQQYSTTELSACVNGQRRATRYTAMTTPNTASKVAVHVASRETGQWA